MSERIIQELTERVARLEKELGQLKAEVSKKKPSEQPWWEKIAGSQKGDKVFAEIARLGAEIRQADREATIRKIEKENSKTRRVKAKPASGK